MKKLILTVLIFFIAFIVYAQEPITGEDWNSYDLETKELAIKCLVNGQYSIIWYFSILGEQGLSENLYTIFDTDLSMNQIIKDIDEYYANPDNENHFIFMAYLVVTGKVYEKKEVL